jgi:hypothetical protein
MDPLFCENDKALFYKYLDKASHYFEFGSGGSTYQASLRPNIQKIYSVESDSNWHNKLKSIIPTDDKISYIYVNMHAGRNNWGYPGKAATLEEMKKYSDVIRDLDKNLSNEINLILIDGRFRAACALKCFDVIDEKCFIIFDDFFIRPSYKIVLDYFEIVDKTSSNSMVILKKKNVDKPSETIISKYEKISL